MRCVIMAGGRGERLRPLTDTCPKPLLPVAGRPVIDRLLEKVAEAGLQDVTIAVGYLGQQIMDYCGTSKYGLRLDYVIQDQPMGTAGALTLLPRDQPMLVINGDKVFESASDLRLVIENHDGGVAVGTVPVTLPCGVFIDGDFQEKPTLQANAGIYALSPPVLQLVQAVMDMTALLGYAYPVPLNGYVLDIGTPASYEAACARLS